MAFIWGVAFIYPKKYFEVYALIRSVASIRVWLLFGGVTPFFEHLLAILGERGQTGEFLEPPWSARY